MKTLFSTRRRMLAITLPLVIVPLLMVLLLNNWLSGSYVRNSIIERLNVSNRRINAEFDAYTDKIESIMRRMIVNSDIQDTLTRREFTHGISNAVTSFLKFYNYADLRVIAYWDNQGNLMHTYEGLPYPSTLFANSHIASALAGTYGKQVWTYHRDDVFLGNDTAIFVSRFIRHLDVNVAPGILVFKIDPAVLDEIFDAALMVDGADYLLVDRDEKLIYSTDDERQSTMAVRDFAGGRTGDGTYLVSRHENELTGWEIIGFIPYRIALRPLRRMQATIYLVMLLAAAGTVAVVYIATFRFTSPIHDIELAMHEFRDGNFDTRVRIKKDDEIGEIGKSFNLMADEIETLLNTIKKDQEDLTAAELQSLVYQINPHFIYNTLDNVHMLARASGDERISALILSLTRFLRISLSKGHNIIRLKDEFSHVEQYLAIQKIRFGDLFDYAITLDPLIADQQIVKFVLQPLAENCIIHGFREIDTGGFIRIAGAGDDAGVIITVEDNGVGIKPVVSQRLNSLLELDTEGILEAFPNRSGGYGIGNAVARLKIYHGKDFTVEFSGKPGCTRCVLRIRGNHL